MNFLKFILSISILCGITQAAENISFVSEPASMVSSTKITYELNYTLDTKKDIVLSLSNPENKLTSTARKTLDAGSGKTSITIDLGTYTPTPRAGHKIKASIQDIGANESSQTLVITTTVKFTPNSSPSNYPEAPAGKKWAPVNLLTDEFNTTALNPTKWRNDHPNWNGREPSQYKQSNVSVNNGMLQLLSDVKNADQQGNWVNSSCVSSQETSAEVGSYFEASVRGSDISMTSAFWLQGSGLEIDVTENFGYTTAAGDYYFKQRSQMLSNTHSFEGGWDNDITTSMHADMDAESDHRFITYGVYWKSPTVIEMYLDGKKVNTMTPGHAFTKNQYMYFDTETFKWQGYPTVEELQDPDRNMMYVDWVRSYKLVDDTTTISDPEPDPEPETKKAYPNGIAHSLPGIIQAENYDFGGEGVSFHDSESENRLGEYRNDGVDIETTSDIDGNYNIGWVADNEWLEYTVKTDLTNDFNVSIRSAAQSETGKVSLSIDGNIGIPEATLAATGDWQSFQTTNIGTISLEKGEHVIRLFINQGNFNLNYLEFTKAQITTNLITTQIDDFKLEFNNISKILNITNNSHKHFFLVNVNGSQIQSLTNGINKLNHLVKGVYYISNGSQTKTIIIQ